MANSLKVTMEQIALAGGREAALGLDDEVRTSIETNTQKRVPWMERRRRRGAGGGGTLFFVHAS